MLPKLKVEWIPEAKALEMLGIDDRDTLRKHVASGELKIAYTQINQKAKRFYNKFDIEAELLRHSTLAL
jgi:hypothetical protein